ncbi:MAG: hypothetical protein EBX16_08565, partial [Burkholderiaceae bacterium]|nr:hypothetical protein [Burkholderiaceae bacterium]
LGSDCPAVLLAARSSVKANLHAAEAWYLMSKVKEHYLKAQQALANGDSEAAAKHLRKAKEIEALKNYEEKAAEAEANKPENILKKQLTDRKQNAAPIYIPLDEMIVNLPGRGGEHYLQTKIVLRTADSSTEGKVKQFMPVIRDKIITVLSSRQMQELATVEGKTMMAREVALVINSIIAPQLTAIYILQQQPNTADLQNLERIGAIPKETSTGKKITNEAARAAAEFWNVTEMDLPVQAVLFSSFVMQ